MASKVSYKINSTQNGQLIQVMTTRKKLAIRIAFKEGGVHKNWYLKDKLRMPLSSGAVAKALIRGTDWSHTPKPIFTLYRRQNKDFITHTLFYYLVEHYQHDSWQNRLARAGWAIKEDIVEQTRSGSLGLPELKSGKYSDAKAAAYPNGNTFFASGALLDDLEVYIES